MKVKKYIITNVTTGIPKECFSSFEELRACSSLAAAEKAAFFVARVKTDVNLPDNGKVAAMLNALTGNHDVKELNHDVVVRPGCVPTGVYNFYDVLGLMQEYLGEEFDVDEYFEFASDYVVTADDVRRMFEIDRLKKELDEEYNVIKAHILQDAELFKDGTLFSTYELESRDGIISVTDKQTVEVLRAGALVDILRDQRRDVVQETVGHKIGATHSKLFVDLYCGNVGKQTTEEFFKSLYSNYRQYYYKKENVNDCSSFAKQLRKQLKKDYRKNVVVFGKLFQGVSEDEHLKMAEDYYKACNYDEFLKLLVLAGINPADEDAVSSFVAQVKATYAVTNSAAFTLKAKS